MAKNLRQVLLLTLFLLLVGSEAVQAQPEYYTVNNYSLSIHKRCSTIERIRFTNEPIENIAITPNGTLYGTSKQLLYKIDTSDGSTLLIGQLINPDGLSVKGNNLVALNDSTLMVLDLKDILYSVNIKDGAATPIGTVNYKSGGDLAFLEGKLYLSSIQNHLIQISLSPTNDSVEHVADVGEMVVENSAYSLCTIQQACRTKALFVINAKGKAYKVDTKTAATEFVCDLGVNTSDAASYHNFAEAILETKPYSMPNVFTPNADGINDLFAIDDSVLFNYFRIYNRWGELVYQVEHGPLKWDGTHHNQGKDAEAGTYFFQADLKADSPTHISSAIDQSFGCPTISAETLNRGTITLMR